MGINIPTREELIANKLSSQQLAKHLGKILKKNPIEFNLRFIYLIIIQLFIISNIMTYIPMHYLKDLGHNRFFPLSLCVFDNLFVFFFFHSGADSVVYLSVDGLQEAVMKGVEKRESTGHCKACLTGKYPVDLQW